jgi:hypothetical protein
VRVFEGSLKWEKVKGHDMQCIPESADLRFHGSIYGIGDSICFINPKTNTPVPGTARAAMTQATNAASTTSFFCNTSITASLVSIAGV